MLRPFGPGLPSDAIAHRYGCDGNEPRELDRLWTACASLGVRSTFTIHTFYQEIASGFYVNRALFGLIDGAMRVNGILPVVEDNWRLEGLVPVEGEGHLLVDEPYVLAAESQTQIGILQTWCFHAGGGGPYYGGNIIFDFILPEEKTRQLVDEVEVRCHAGSVRFRREPRATPGTPRRRKGWLM